MLYFGSQLFTNVSVSPFICTLLSSFIFTYAFHLLLIHFLVISWQDYDIEFINKKGSSLEHIREREDSKSSIQRENFILDEH
jgi:hypothetical protein